MNLRYHLLWLAITAPLFALGLTWFESQTDGTEFSGRTFGILFCCYVVVGLLLYPLQRRLSTWTTKKS